MFRVRSIYFPNAFDLQTKLVEYFARKFSKFRMFWAKIRDFSSKMLIMKTQYILNVVSRLSYFFHDWGQKTDYSRMFSLQNKIFSNDFCRNSIFFKCFRPESRSFRIFWAGTRFFPNVLFKNTELFK